MASTCASPPGNQLSLVTPAQLPYADLFSGLLSAHELTASVLTQARDRIPSTTAPFPSYWEITAPAEKG